MISEIRAKNIPFFYITESIPTDEKAGSAEEQLRKAINLQKKRHFKAVALKKGKQNEL